MVRYISTISFTLSNDYFFGIVTTPVTNLHWDLLLAGVTGRLVRPLSFCPSVRTARDSCQSSCNCQLLMLCNLCYIHSRQYLANNDQGDTPQTTKDRGR